MATVVSSGSGEQMNRLLDHYHFERRGIVMDEVEEEMNVCGCVKGKREARQGRYSSRKVKNKKKAKGGLTTPF